MSSVLQILQMQQQQMLQQQLHFQPQPHGTPILLCAIPD